MADPNIGCNKEKVSCKTEKESASMIFKILLGIILACITIGVGRLFVEIDKKANKTEVAAIKEELGKKASKTELRVTDERVDGLEKRFDENVSNILYELRELRKDLKLKEDKKYTNLIMDTIFIDSSFISNKNFALRSKIFLDKKANLLNE